MEFTHVANPVRVMAEEIVQVIGRTLQSNRGIVGVVLNASGEPRETVFPAEMVARYEPQSGDYLVTQEGGYQYINPKAVFERKYRALEPNEEFDTLALSLELSGHRSEIRTRDARIEELEAEVARLIELEKANCWANASGLDARAIRQSVYMQERPHGPVQLVERCEKVVQYILTGELHGNKVHAK